MLKLTLQNFGYLMQRTESLGKILMLRKIEGRRRRGQQRMRWLYSITNSMDMSLSNLMEKAMAPHSSTLAWRMDGGAWRATVHGVAKSQT